MSASSPAGTAPTRRQSGPRVRTYYAENENDIVSWTDTGSSSASQWASPPRTVSGRPAAASSSSSPRTAGPPRRGAPLHRHLRLRRVQVGPPGPVLRQPRDRRGRGDGRRERRRHLERRHPDLGLPARVRGHVDEHDLRPGRDEPGRASTLSPGSARPRQGSATTAAPRSGSIPRPASSRRRTSPSTETCPGFSAPRLGAR